MKNKIILSLCFLSSFTVTHGAENLLTNPGFESQISGWKKSGSFSAVKTSVQSGIYSARGGKLQGTLTQNVMSKLKVGGKYTLSVFAKIDAMAVSSMVSIRFKNSKGALLQENRMVINTTNYKQYTTDFTVPTGSTIAEVFAIKESGASSYLYIDNLSLTSLDVPTEAPINSAPAILSTQSISTNEDTTISFNLNSATDTDGDALTYSIVTPPNSGALNCSGGSSKACSYTPAQNINGNVSFTYKANDGKVDSNIATATITILPVNDLPTLPASQSVSTKANTAITFNLNTGSDVENSPLTYLKVTNPSTGSLNCQGGTSTTCTYTPATNFSGTTSFTYKANDGIGDSNLSTVNISVSAVVNTAPVLPATQTISTAYQTPVNFNLQEATDAEGQSLNYINLTAPSNGTLSCQGGSSTTCTFTPNTGFSGVSTFTYKANDGLVDSNTATVSINVASAPITIPETKPTAGYIPLGVGGGGAMSGVSISPYANLWFVGTDMGTLFKSTDLGQSWNAVNHLQAVFDSDLTRAVSVGFSADGTTVFHASAGVNPKRSLDSGETFSAINMGLTSGEIIKYWYSDSSDANIMYAGTTKGLLRTSNKGTSWSRVSGIAEEAVGTFIDHNTNGRVYHATKTKILLSSDDGITFTQNFTPSTGSIRLFTGGADSSGVTLAISDSDGANACSWVYPYLNDWGQTSINETVANCGYVWVNKNGAGFTKTNQAVGDHLKMADNDSTTIYTTGARKWIRQYGTKVHVSRDKGQTWGLKLNQINYDVIPYAPWPKEKLEWSAVALDVGWWDSGYESFAINQRNSNVVAGSGYFFLHSSLNAGENWQAPFTKYADTGTPTAGKKWITRGLEVISVYRMKFHPTNSSLLYGATADIGGVVSEDKGGSFRIPAHQYNSFYDYAFDPNDDLVVYAAAGSLHDFPNEWHANAQTANGGVYKSIDRGRSFKRLTPVDANYNRQFLSIGYDARNDVIYAGTHEVGIAMSRDDGASWSMMNAGLPAGNKIIPQIEVDPNTGNVYALLTGDAPTFSNQPYTGIYFLDIANGATSWKLLRGVVNYPKDADAGYKVWYYPTAFAIDFNNPSTIWLVDYENHGNWLMTGAWKTTDNGATWNRMKQITHATDIKIDPRDPNQVHVSGYYDLSGTWGNGGMLYTKDGGLTWSKNTTPPLQRNARSVALDPNDPSKIYYSYFGGGILHGDNPAN